ncbi:MAG TPA: RNA methyltransferase [Termitinemataceae bacterium]|nr:RNA methyltransferase [Termitinemataceae bacterium]HOM22253.1 RNA methyltransferase [Termitinemataceae bacterium]HPP99325.1 RNA methyltransferase [Termitinemataceae bacterium]
MPSSPYEGIARPGGEQPFSLPDRDLRREGLLVAEGRLLVERVLERYQRDRAPREWGPIALYCIPSAEEEARRLVSGKGIPPQACPIIVLSEQELSTATGYPFHRGMLLLARRPAIASLETERDLPPQAQRLVYLPHTIDAENLGTITRTAAALGWDGLLLGPSGADPLGRRALRCSMGATLVLPIWYVSEPSRLSFFSQADWSIIGASLEESALLPSDLQGLPRLILVLGNERHGLPPDIRSLCQGVVAIPQKRTLLEGIDSLNVAAAAAILLWEGIKKE